jgi:S-adenosylmethionine-diacylglycerol 3-amino-3-carboxypropyl transferase
MSSGFIPPSSSANPALASGRTLRAMANRIAERFHRQVFDALYNSSLVYNACWEDPACDRAALELGGDDRVLVITSGGCNALDYLLCAPARVHAVDANPRQTALIELKAAGIRALGHEDFWLLFGEGRHPDFPALYRRHLRPQLGPFARAWWDRRQHWFDGDGWCDSFYFRGLSGLVARAMRTFIDRRKGLRPAVEAMLEAPTLENQRVVYDREVAPRLWTAGLRWAVSRRTTLSLLGVPHEQTLEVARAHQQGVAGFVRASIERVFRELPLHDNYFWQVYVRGAYRRDCCPEYLKPGEFARLKAGLIDRLELHTATVTATLRTLAGRGEPVTRFVLLDHMDWMGASRPDLLAEEWDAIHACAGRGARAIFRSAHADAAYLAAVRLSLQGRQVPLTELLAFRRELAAELHRRDRVGTYGGFHIADLVAA